MRSEPVRAHRRLLATLLIASLTCACAPSSAAPPLDVAGALPALPQGAHLGTHITYENLPRRVAKAVDTRIGEARAAGMGISRVHVGWAELEPKPGVFDLDPLSEALAGVPTNDAVLVLIETIDSDGFALPPDLVGDAGGYALAPGRQFGDAVINERFAALLKAVAPLLAARRVFAISVGNEPDNYFDDVNPASRAGAAWNRDMTAFLRSARRTIRQSLPNAAVGMTLTQISIEKGRGASLAPILAASDVALFNYYCQDTNMQVEPAHVVAGEIDQIVARANGRPVVFQEVGCPAGAAPSRIAASAARQRAFLAAFGEELAARPELRAAFWFQAVDWSPALAAAVADALAQAGYPELGARFEETLATIGLLRYRDGVARPAWAEFLGVVRRLR